MTWLRPSHLIDSLSFGIVAHELSLLWRTRCRNTMYCRAHLILCAAVAVFATKAGVVLRVNYVVLGSFYIMGLICW